jgi:ABC-type sugar transport system ATPase subunit
VSGIVLEGVTKVFPRSASAEVRALDQVSFALAPGERLALIGPSGSGKTTLLRIIAGLEPLTSGNVRLNGQIANHTAAAQREVALVFQAPALFPQLSVADNIALGLRLRKFPAAEVEARVRQAAEFLALSPLLTRKPDTLSGGESQRVMLARALVRQPAVFLLDEPMAHLDPVSRGRVRSEILRLHRKIGCALIYATHDHAEAFGIAERVAVLSAGRIEQIGTPLELYLRPATVFVAGFVGQPPMNLLPGRIAGRGPELWFEAINPGAELKFKVAPPHLDGLRKYAGNQVWLGIRPEHLLVPGGSPGPPVGAVNGTVQNEEWSGREKFVQLQAGEVMLTAQTEASAPRYELDQVLTAYCDPKQVHYFDMKSQQRIGT